MMLKVPLYVGAVSLLYLVCTTSGYAQDGQLGIGHEKFHPWYNTLKDRHGTSCCNDRDCRPTHSRMKEGSLEVQVDGEWMKVPPETILTNKNPPDLGDHVCAIQRNFMFNGGSPIRCVILGSGV